MKRIVIALAATIATSAYAWGDREQGVAQAIVGIAVLDYIVNNGSISVQTRPGVVTAPPPYYGAPGHRPDWGQYHPHPQAVYPENVGRCPWGTQEYFVRGRDSYGRIHYVFQGCR